MTMQRHRHRSTRTEDGLLATLNDVQMRGVVEETLRSMLVDVELAASFEKDLVAQEEQRHLQKRALASELALQEARVVEQQEQKHRNTLADDLVKELWALSQQLGSLKRWKSENEGTIQERDQLVAKLLQAEEQIDILRSMPMVQAMALKDQPDSKDQPDWKANENDSKPAAAAAKSELPEQPQPELTTSAELGGVTSVQPEDANEQSMDPFDAATAETTESQPTPEEIPTTEPESSAAAAAVVSIVVEEDGEAPQLATFEEPILLQIFAFLDALEIVQLAQVSIGLYSRVDSLFGISGEDGPPVPKEVQTTTPQPPVPAHTQATIVQLPPSATQPKKKTIAQQLPEKKPPTVGKGLISLFQTGRAAAAVEQKPKPAEKESSKQPLSAAMANSMAEKLSDKEINAIISMTEKLNKRNKEVEVLTQQNMELHGKLDGTEAVKQFLVTKVREIEQTLQKSKDVESKTTQQIASDQEVIAFLDSRVQELERSENTLATEKKSVSDQLISVQIRNEKKISVLSDMLQYERERLAENERDWKATRKVLVKEVKSCRAHIMSLQAEKDGLQEQNERLKRAVMASGAMNGSK